jgi:hypothetical protein
MVVVTASGGGITAARWSTEVLTRLQYATDKFGESIVLISTVSGGGVGAMYFVDAYKDGRPPATEEILELIRTRSAESSLLASAWGFAYRDIFWSSPLIRNRHEDRGWALEQTWIRRLSDPESTLRKWQQGILNDDWRPIQVFNATITETGDRFLLTPMNLSAALDTSKNFLDLYQDHDLSVATAARLSATFPFVSPIARPPKNTVPEQHAYHLADGGYYDNHGVVTAIDFLREILPIHEQKCKSTENPGVESGEADLTATSAAEPDRQMRPPVYIIQIRSTGKESKEVKKRRGFYWATYGPIKTLMNVRTSTQISRNNVEMDLLIEAWKNNVEIKTWEFELPDTVEAPLSWHLTDQEVQSISDAWTMDHDSMIAEVASLLE